MNKQYVLYQLNEALEQLQSTVKYLETNSDYDHINFREDLKHLYHHLNTAWNSKFSSKEATENCSEKDFNTWRQFPIDIFIDN